MIENPNIRSIIAGSTAGAFNGFILNPIAAVKYSRWNETQKRSFVTEMRLMYTNGGIAQFMKGMYATMTRDIIFGSTFAYQRYLRRRNIQQERKHLAHDDDIYQLPYAHKLWIDMSSAFISTIISSPFNFVRNMQYAETSANIPSSFKCLQQLYFNGWIKEDGSVVGAVRWWLFRLRIGWGTARVAVGMGITSMCFELYGQLLERY